MSKLVRTAASVAGAFAVWLSLSGCPRPAGESLDSGVLPDPDPPPDAFDPDKPYPVDPPVDEVRFYHFDVGQADATLVWAPEATILIDAGDWRESDVMPYLQELGIDQIDLLMFTHPHADHIGQATSVLDAIDVTEVWMTGWEHSSRTYERTLDAVLASDAGYHEPEVGETQQLGDVVVEVINPGDSLSSVHDCLAVRIRHGDFAAIYTGDAEAEHEAAMVARNADLSADLLQLGHHGSRTSSSLEFLEAVDPDIAIYSAALDSQYNHPHVEVVQRVEGLGIQLLGTPESGTIVITTDGQGYAVHEQAATASADDPPTDEPASQGCPGQEACVK